MTCIFSEISRSNSETARRRFADNCTAQIFFIEDNHDSAARQIRASFAWFNSVKMVEVNGQPIWLSHYAHRVWMRAHYGAWHLYGHSHHSLPDDPHGAVWMWALTRRPHAWDDRIYTAPGRFQQKGCDLKTIGPSTLTRLPN